VSQAAPSVRGDSLRNTPLFGGASSEIVELVLARAPQLRVSSGDYFFRQGERGVAVYWLETGRVAILKRWEEREIELRKLEAGDCFGEIALFDFGPRSASVRALEDCTALELAPALFREIRERDLEQFALLTLNMGRELSRRLRSAEDRLFRGRMQSDDPQALPST
jgi:CRP/FNR family transcriptional regulator, cyclic AMP receptor protein